MFSAEQARNKNYEKASQSDLVNRFFREVELAIENNESSMYFTICNSGDFSPSEYQLLTEELKFNLSWNRSCLWYEVDWSK